MPLSNTAALRAAQAAVGRPFGHGTSWCLYHPYYDRVDGPTTEMSDSSYTALMQRRAIRVAELALALMGIRDAAIYSNAPGSARELLNDFFKGA